MNSDALRMRRGQELPVALALLAVARRRTQLEMDARELERMRMFIDGARTAIENFIDQLDAADGTDIYARAARFVERIQCGLDKLQPGTPPA